MDVAFRELEATRERRNLVESGRQAAWLLYEGSIPTIELIDEVKGAQDGGKRLGFTFVLRT